MQISISCVTSEVVFEDLRQREKNAFLLNINGQWSLLLCLNNSRTFSPCVRKIFVEFPNVHRFWEHSPSYSNVLAICLLCLHHFCLRSNRENEWALDYSLPLYSLLCIIFPDWRTLSSFQLVTVCVGGRRLESLINNHNNWSTTAPLRMQPPHLTNCAGSQLEDRNRPVCHVEIARFSHFDFS